MLNIHRMFFYVLGGGPTATCFTLPWPKYINWPSSRCTGRAITGGDQLFMGKSNNCQQALLASILWRSLYSLISLPASRRLGFIKMATSQNPCGQLYLCLCTLAGFVLVLLSKCSWSTCVAGISKASWKS